MKTATTHRGATYTYTYDGRGSVKSRTGTTSAGHLVKTTSTTSYPGSSDTEYTVVSRDELNRDTTSTYNAKNGTLKSVTDGKGTVSYTYNANNDILESVTQGGANVSYTYNNSYKNLLGISTGTSSYSFTYDEFGNRTSTKVGGYTLATYSYGANNGPMLSMKYGSAGGSLDTISYTYDKYGNTSEKRVNGTLVYEGIADNTGAVTKAIDHENNLQYNYVYDSTDRLVSSTRVNTADNSRAAMFEYDFDLNNNLTKLAVLTPNGSNVTNYVYGKDNLPETATFSNGKKLTYTYDTLGRNNKITIDTATPITTDYTYCAYSDGTDTYRSNLLHTEISEDFKYRYTYDSRNNITLIEEGTLNSSNALVYTAIESYTYDALDQLKQVDYLTQNKRVAYIYDLGGNITKEKVYTLANDGTATLSETNSYTYGDVNWSDKLTKYKGQTITYDEIGNPLTYRDGFTFTWSNGRQLDSLTKNGKTVSYTYDTNGMRLTKTVDGVENTYLYEDGLLVQETRGNMIFDYSYDANGRLTMGAYRANESASPGYFYYALNSRGDVIGLYNSSGTLIGKYTYDTWGNVTSITNAGGVDVSNQNNMLTRQPFRYRSYYYDQDSGFYYLQSRYYDPVTHRFINADGLVSTGTGILGHNMFAYCDNNPVNRYDFTGCSWLSNAWNSIKNFGKKVWNSFTTWCGNTFGAGCTTTETLRKNETPVIPSPYPVTLTMGETTTQTVTNTGNSSKPISVYANGNLDDRALSSVGLNIHVDNFKLNINLALDNIGGSFSIINNNVEDTFALKADLTEFQLGIETSTAISWDNTTEIAYTNVSGSGWYIACILGLGSDLSISSYAPKYAPSY